MQSSQNPQLQPNNTRTNFLSFSWSFRSEIVLIVIFLVIAFLYTLLVIRDSIPTAGLVVLAGLWLLHWVMSGHLSYSTPQDLPIIGLLSLLPLSLLISVDHALTLPKIYGLLLCVALYYVIINYLRTFKRIPLALAALILLTTTMPVLGLLAVDWSGSSFTLPSRILNRLSMYVPLISRFSTGGGIHVNTIGGTLTFFIPLLISLLWDGKAFRSTFLAKSKKQKTFTILYKLILIVALIMVLGILILTQSRGSYLGAAVGILAVLIWKDKRFLWLIPVLILSLVVALYVFANGNVIEFISIMDTSREGDTFWVRLDYWKRTVYLIQDFAFSGVGIGTYGKIFDELYTFTPFSSQGQPAFYAHNMYLAVAASVGIPALVLYFALFSSTATMVFSSYKKAQPIVKIMLIGISSGWLANLVYGLWDNYMLGEKLALVLWLYLALVTAFYIHQNTLLTSNGSDPNNCVQAPASAQVKQWFTSIFFGLVYWILFSLAALAFININAYVSLVLAALGGIMLGYLLTRRFETGAPHLQPAAAD